MTEYKTELHAHTTPASACSDIEPEKLVEIYKDNGYSSVVITNHFRYVEEKPAKKVIEDYLADYYTTLEYGKKAKLNVILGAEVRFTENHNDYLVYGILPEDLARIYELLPYGIDNFYKNFKNDKNIIIQAHPFRNGMEPVCPENLDGIEVFNMHPNHNSRIAVAAEYALENRLISTCGSDFHHYGQECLCAMITWQPLVNSYEVARTIKSGNYKMNICGYDLVQTNIDIKDSK